MKKAVVIGIVSMIFMPAMAINENMNHTSFITDVDGKTLYVGGSGPDNYTKIQDAIDVANDGDTVFVYDDSSPYYENIVINKSINLVGENKDTTVILGKGGEDVISIFTNDLTIKNFTITGSYMPRAGIYVFNTNRNKISDCILKDNGVSIFFIDSSNNNISYCSISNSSDGIRFTSSSNNQIYGCEIYENYEGVYVDGGYEEYSCGNIIKNCNIFSNGECGVKLIYSSNAKVLHSTFSSNSHGLQIFDSYNISVSNCDFTRDGIHIKGENLQQYLHEIENNSVNGKSLLYFVNENNIDLDSVEIGQIIMVNCSNFKISDITIGNTDVGIEMVYGVKNEIENCKIYGNDDCGILIKNSSCNEISSCEIKSKYGYGLRLVKSSKNIVSRNHFIKNNGCVIQLIFSDDNEITKNLIDGKYNPQIGIRIDESKRNFIAYNNITGCWDTGLVIASRLSIDKNTIYKNNFYRNGIHAIWLADTFANKIMQNNFIEHPVQASYENAWNIWLNNYWDNWKTPFPKPIYGYIESFRGIPIFPLINFDWMPSLNPIEVEK